MPKKPLYRIVREVCYRDPDDPEAEIVAAVGDEVSDLPADSIDWLLRDGAIEPVVARSKGGK